jgi:NAD(P)-dependent dehydrogenase (short-subunit alcohol dehydrogenase family)
VDRVTFDGRVAVVTGAGRGIGREYARLLAAHGAQVVVDDPGTATDGAGQDAGPAEQVAAEINADGGRAVAVTEGVETAEGGAAIIDAALATFGQVDIIVNNAGILRDKTFARMTPEMFDAVLATHLRGTIHVTQAAWPHFATQGFGRIVNVTSSAGLFGNFGQASYAAAKMGIVGLTKVLAIEGARHGITANVIAPGAATRMTGGLLTAEQQKLLAPELVAPFVGWLAHPDCRTTGGIFSAAGGRFSRVVVAVNRGFYTATPTVESVRDNFAEIFDPSGLTVPADISAEFDLLLAAIDAAQL